MLRAPHDCMLLNRTADIFTAIYCCLKGRLVPGHPTWFILMVPISTGRSSSFNGHSSETNGYETDAMGREKDVIVSKGIPALPPLPEEDDWS